MKEIYTKINNFLAKNSLLLFIIILLCLSYIFFQRTPKPTAKRLTSTFSNYAVARANISDTTVNNLSLETKKIAKNYSINLLVENVDNYYNNINNLLKTYKGYLENFSSYKNDNNETLYLNVKIPAEKVDDFLKSLKGDAYVKSENFYAIDYTEKYSDNKNKLKNLYVRRDKLRNMMTKEAKVLADVIAVEKELNNVQLEIEKLEKNNMKIDNEVEYSNVNITLEPNIKKVNWSLKDAFMSAINLLLVVCLTILHYFIVFVVFIPLILVFLILYILFRKVYNFIKNRCIKQ